MRNGKKYVHKSSIWNWWFLSFPLCLQFVSLEWEKLFTLMKRAVVIYRRRCFHRQTLKFEVWTFQFLLTEFPKFSTHTPTRGAHTVMKFWYQFLLYFPQFHNRQKNSHVDEEKFSKKVETVTIEFRSDNNSFSLPFPTWSLSTVFEFEKNSSTTLLIILWAAELQHSELKQIKKNIYWKSWEINSFNSCVRGDEKITMSLK